MKTPKGKNPRGQDMGLPILDDPAVLADLQGWSEEVYTDFLALQGGTMSRDVFRAKYLRTRAILNIDMTGFTQSSIRESEIDSLLRIFDIQKIAFPVLQSYGSGLVRAFADDLVALFDDVHAAFDAALEIHDRVAHFNKTSAREVKTECCAGIGFGQVYAIGPNLAQGAEMNLASKLGEDIARGGETLLTENAHAALGKRDRIDFEQQIHDDLDVAFFRVLRR